MPYGLSPLHLLIALAAILLVLGPSRLPETGAAMGKAVRGFRDALEGRDEVSPPSPTPTPSGGTVNQADPTVPPSSTDASGQPPADPPAA
jgi:sec-independent protein translocase protein TatA